MPAVFHSTKHPQPAPEAPKIVLLSRAEQVEDASADTLHRALIDAGGCGPNLKTLALGELLRRSFHDGVKQGAAQVT